MAVTWKKKGTSPSNKPRQYTMQLSSIAYSYQVTGMGEVDVTQPFIDKLTVTAAISDPKLRDLICAALIAGKEDDSLPTVIPAKAPKSNYKIAVFHVDAETNQKVLIQVAPSKKATTANFLRLEFNPARLGPDGVARLDTVLRGITADTMGWDEVSSAGRVTRVDVAVDLVNCPKSRLVFLKTKEGKSHKYFGSGGELQTSYFGKPKKGASSTKAYDKATELKEKGKPSEYSGVNRTRIEITKRPMTTVQQLANLHNPFEEMLIADPAGAPKACLGYVWQLYLDSCRYRGVDEATNLLPSDLQDSLRGELVERSKLTWMPIQLWKEWPNYLKTSGLLNSYS